MEHFSSFFVTGVAFALGYTLRGAILAISLIVFTAGVELAQLFVAGRYARWSDFIVDALAITIGLGVIKTLAWWRAHRSAQCRWG